MKGPKVVVADYGDFTRPVGDKKVVPKKRGKVAAKKVAAKRSTMKRGKK